MQRRELLMTVMLSPLAHGLKKIHDDPMHLRDLNPLDHGSAVRKLASQRAKISTRPDRWGIAPRAEKTPTIDGHLDEPLWSDAQSHTGFVTPFYHEPLDADVSLRFAYDDEAVYVAISYASEDAGASVAQIDVVLRPSGDGGQCFRVPLIIRKTKPAFSNDWGPDITDLTDVESAFVVGDAGITAEIRVPLSAVDVKSVKDGDEWRANVIIEHEMMTKPLSTWIPIRTSMHRYNGQDSVAAVKAEVIAGDHLGSIFLGTIPTLPKHTKPPRMFTPEASTLAYKSFTEKELSFAAEDIRPHDEVRLEWRAPDQAWAPVVDPSEERDRSTITIRFSHPGRTNKGLYQVRVLVVRSNPRERSVDKVAVLTFDRLDLIRAGRLVQPTATPPRQTKRVRRSAASKETERLLGLIPDRSGFRFVGLPDRPELHPDKVYNWDPDNPDVLASAYSDLVYPHDQYPEDQLITVTNRLGEQVEYPYHEDADGKRFFISGHIWFQKREYILSAIGNLAATDPLGTARVLHALVPAYQGWVSTNEYPWFNRPVEAASVTPNYYWGGTWSRWSASELNGFRELPSAFAVVAETDAFDVLSDEVGEDVRDLILHKMFEPSVDFHRSFSMIYHNMDYTNNLGLASMALAFQDSDYLHEVVEWAVEYARVTYLFDGFYKETSLSYHDQATGGTSRVLDVIKGWTDPKGFISPRTGKRFDDLDLRAETPVLASAENVGNLVVYPTGKLFPMDDTWAASGAGAPQLDAGSFLLPASGLARLARGTGSGAAGYFGIVHGFMDLEVTAASTAYAEFPSSGTVQLDATTNGASITFAFAVEKADTYEVDFRPFRAGSYGRYAIAVDDQQLAEFDFYAAGSGPDEFETLGAIALSAGDHSITFTGVGQNDAATNFKMGVVQLALLDAAAQQARDEAGDGPAEPVDPSQTYLKFTTKYGHHHYDPLAMALYAEGQELLPDIGYTHTFYRRWSMSGLAHNTVVVDSADMSDEGAAADGGDIEVFAQPAETVQVVRASQATAYPQTEDFRRELWSIGFGSDNNAGYLLDLFHVKGGERHEYTLHGDANHDATFTTDAELTDYGPYLLPEGVKVTEPTTEIDFGDAEGHYYGYIYVRKVQRTELADGSFEVALATQDDDGEPLAGARIIGLGDDVSSELFLGESPSMRATRLKGTAKDINSEAVKYWLPTLVVRRDGTDLQSQFVTLIEPYAAGASAQVDSVERLTVDQGGDDSVALQITHAKGVDLVLSSSDPNQPMVAGDVTLTGKLGMIRLNGDTVTAMYLVGGTSLIKGSTELTNAGPVTGKLTGVRRRADGDDLNAFVVDTAIPESMIGTTLVVTHPDATTHGYKIKSIITVDGSTIAEVDGVDPGFTFAEDGSTELQFFPFTAWTGDTTFRIENAIHHVP